MTTTASTSALADQLRERIRREGPITFRDWMDAALYDPLHGYYCRPDRKRWGREGDYRTSPERTSLFGATLARYVAKLYDEAGKPHSLSIVEYGAGDGHFAALLLAALETYFPDVFAVTRYSIYERSSHSTQLAQQRLQPFADRVSVGGFEDIEDDFGIVFSNELVDAFPVNRVKTEGGQLREFYVDVSESGEFKWTLRAPSVPHILKYFESIGIVLGEGQIAEVNFEIKPWQGVVAQGLKRGFAITVDYGAETNELHPASSDDPRYLGTLRSFQRHQIMDSVLSHPGEQDITSTINWSYVKDVGNEYGLKVIELTGQDKFLLAAGLLEQLETETKNLATEADKLRLNSAALEMILPTRMGAHFQVLVQQKA